jgi:hypothetical protein
MGEIRNEYKILVETPNNYKSLGRTSPKLENDIKMDHKQIR